MKSICIIPARAGSKGLLSKNIQTINDKPLLSYPIDACLKSGVIDKILVSTDSVEIQQVALRFGAECPFLRDSAYAQDTTTMEDTLQNALITAEDFYQEKYDICVFLTCTDIFRKPEWIAEAVNYLKTSPSTESVFSAYRCYKNYWEELPNGFFQRLRPYMQIYGQRQERLSNKRLIYREDTGLASASRSFLWRNNRRIGDVVHIIPNDDSFSSLDIHTIDDLRLVEAAFKIRNASN